MLRRGWTPQHTAARARSSPRGKLRVEVGSSIANIVIIPALPDFRARYPDIELLLGVSDRPVDLIEDGVDCVIRGGELADTSLIGTCPTHSPGVGQAGRYRQPT